MQGVLTISEKGSFCCVNLPDKTIIAGDQGRNTGNSGEKEQKSPRNDAVSGFSFSRRMGLPDSGKPLTGP